MLNNLTGGTIELSKIHQTDGETGVIREIARLQDRLLDLYDRLYILTEDHYGENIDLNGFCGE